MIKKYNLLIFNFLFILYMETFFKFFVFKNIFNLQTIFMIMFILTISIIITTIESLFTEKINKIITIIISFCIWLLISAQFIYFQYYDTFFSIYSLFHGAQVFGFIGSIIDVIFQNILEVIILLLPLVALILYIKNLNNERKKLSYYIIILLAAFIIHFTCLCLIKTLDRNETYSSNNLYYTTHVPKLMVKNFGVITEMRLDLERLLFGFKENVILDSNNAPTIEDETTYHSMDIDFDNLIENEDNDTIKSMHEYFKSISPTETNQYTGMFEGKNLIVIIAEAFSPMAINKDLTPTLYKLYNSGFKFTNFYTPVYYVSTSDGEYISLTSLLPKDGTWSMTKSSENYLPFAYGNLFKKYGYETRAYHDGEFNYYNRDKSLPNMGYTYKGCYNGLNINCGMWPQSDIEMIEETTSEYINSEKFMTYYMTVSGHLEYTYNGNSIATKNKKYVSDLPYSEPIQAYLATQIELDKALELLIKKLDEAGKLDDTVIALSADHYPYGLSNEQILEYADYVVDEKFDIHKNSFLLWNNAMNESIEIDKYASSLDILPTILNLFNVEYDSRLLMGKDILSDEEGLVIYNDRSWITDQGKYDSITQKFTPSKSNVSDEYVERINNIVYNKFLMSKLVLENNYYSIIK